MASISQENSEYWVILNISPLLQHYKRLPSSIAHTGRSSRYLSPQLFLSVQMNFTQHTATKLKTPNHMISALGDNLLLCVQVCKREAIKQGVVTCVSRVEVFVTRIKTESSDQSPFGGLIKGSRSVTSELLKINNQECAAAI